MPSYFTCIGEVNCKQGHKTLEEAMKCCSPNRDIVVCEDGLLRDMTERERGMSLPTDKEIYNLVKKQQAWVWITNPNERFYIASSSDMRPNGQPNISIDENGEMSFRLQFGKDGDWVDDKFYKASELHVVSLDNKETGLPSSNIPSVLKDEPGPTYQLENLTNNNDEENEEVDNTNQETTWLALSLQEEE